MVNCLNKPAKDTQSVAHVWTTLVCRCQVCRPGKHLEADENSLHPGVQLQLLHSHIPQGVGILPLAAALHHAHEVVKVKSNNALHS